MEITREQEIRKQIALLEKEIRDLKKELVGMKAYTLVAEYEEDAINGDGRASTKFKHKESHHNTEKLAMDKAREIFNRRTWWVEYHSTKYGYIYNKAHLTLTLNGKVILDIPHLELELNSKFKELVK